MSKQSTLSFGTKRKQEDAVSVTQKKTKIELGSSDAPILLDDEEIKQIVLESPPPTNKTLFGSGPSTANPLAVNPPNFALWNSFSGAKPQVIKKDPDLDLLYFKSFVKGFDLFKYLLNELPWYRVIYSAHNTTIKTPRYTCVWGCDEVNQPNKSYKIKPREIPPVLKELLLKVEQETGEHYNFVLCNYYADGKDSISWHSDDEKFLGPLPCIASLSLGGSRDFMMKHKTDKVAKTEKWDLQNGDMVVMRGTTQSKWLHSIPKRTKAAGRMNLTFRKAVTVGGTNNYYHYNVNTGPVHRWKNGEMVVVP